MKNEIIIEPYGLGHAVVIRNKSKIIDSFIDPPLDASFYPPSTFINAKILREIKIMGGFFVRLPNGKEGFLRSKKLYQIGQNVIIRSKVFFDPNKPQIFTDKLKTKSRYFILEAGRKGMSFSKKIKSKMQRDIINNSINVNISSEENLFLICRSNILELNIDEINNELEKILNHFKAIFTTLKVYKQYYDSMARKEALQTFPEKDNLVIEQPGIFEQLGIWDLLRRYHKEQIEFDKGSYLIIEHTSAFCTIDVNSGSNIKISHEELNFKACDEICNIVKLIGLGGKIVIDFVPCPTNIKKKILEKIALFFFKDSAKTKIWGWTKGGIFEFERERDKSPLKLLLPDN